MAQRLAPAAAAHGLLAALPLACCGPALAASVSLDVVGATFVGTFTAAPETSITGFSPAYFYEARGDGTADARPPSSLFLPNWAAASASASGADGYALASWSSLGAAYSLRPGESATWSGLANIVVQTLTGEAAEASLGIGLLTGNADEIGLGLRDGFGLTATSTQAQSFSLTLTNTTAQQMFWRPYFTMTASASGVAPPVPEPSTYALLGAGLALVALQARRRRKATDSLASA